MRMKRISERWCFEVLWFNAPLLFGFTWGRYSEWKWISFHLQTGIATITLVYDPEKEFLT